MPMRQNGAHLQCAKQLLRPGCLRKAPLGIIELIRNDLPGLLQQQAIVYAGSVILLNSLQALNVAHIV